jgi:hypothetical protein
MDFYIVKMYKDKWSKTKMSMIFFSSIGRLEAGESQTAVAAEHHILPLE